METGVDAHSPVPGTARPEAIDGLVDEWDALADVVGSSPFLRPGWITRWHAAFGRGELVVFAARDSGGRLVAVLPLDRRRGVLRSPTNAHTPEFGILAEDGGAARAVAHAAFATRPRMIALDWLDSEHGRVESILEAGRASGFRAGAANVVARAPWIQCAPTHGDFERRLGRNLRHDVQRKLRRLCEEGAVSVQVFDGRSGDVGALLAEAFEVEERGWKGDLGTAIAGSAPTRDFYSAVARWAASRRWLRLAFMRLDGRAIAFQYDLEAGGVYYSLKIGYDPAFERFSPGKLLVHALVGRATALGLARYELLGTDETWKAQWTTTSHERLGVRLFAGSPVGRLSQVVHVHGRSLVGRVPLASQGAALLRR